MTHRHRFHGDPARFDVVAKFVHDRFGRSVRHIADVAGGQGMLSRILRKRYNYDCEVVDPRGWTLTGVDGRASEFTPDMAEYYDLVIGLHPDQALRPVVEASVVRPVVVLPCCNFWDTTRKLDRDTLLDEIATFGDHVMWERETLEFKGPHNIALLGKPPPS